MACKGVIDLATLGDILALIGRFYRSGYRLIDRNRRLDLSTLVSPQTISASKPSAWFLYMVETEGGRLYTGITTDLRRRFQQHKTGKGGAKFFRSDPPLRLRYTLELPDRSSALKHEYRIKQLSRQQKWQLVAENASGVEIDL